MRQWVLWAALVAGPTVAAAQGFECADPEEPALAAATKAVGEGAACGVSRRVHATVREVQAHGRYQTLWDGRDGAGRPPATGVYLLRLTAERQITRKRMLFR
ncbi:MAG: hypothetical protein ABIL09_03385 [Gemmatimonadota bacterium]